MASASPSTLASSPRAVTPFASPASPTPRISQTLAVPKSFTGLRRSFSPRSSRLVSAPRSSRRSFVVNASQLPLVGNPAPDFQAEAVFDQEFINMNHFDEDEELHLLQITILTMVSVVILLMQNKRPRLCREPKRARLEIRETYLSRLIDGDDTTSITMVRMNKSTFFNLCSILRGKGLLRDTLHMSVEEQLLMFLHTIGHNQRNRVIGHNFLRSGKNVSRYFNHVLFAIGELQHEYVRPPSTQTHPYITSRSTLYPYFKDCIGALDGTHIHASVPASEVAAFRGRKPYPTQNVLAAVDFDLRFTYVLAGWEGSAHDSLVLRDALERPNGLKVPEGKYYLVDAGYATRPGFIAPYRGVRYHLKEFGSRTPANPKELFNLRHSSARTSFERAFGSLKGRFKVLSCRPFFPFKTHAELVLACCILHNYILSGGEDEFIPSEEDWVPHRPSQTTTREQRGEAQEWAARRDQMANEMWANK